MVTDLSDSELLQEAVRIAGAERGERSRLIRVIAEIDSRRLYLSEGFSCMFHYCTRVLHISEAGAYKRIEVARTSQQFPQILDALAEGALTLTTALLLVPHLTVETADDLFAAARFKSKREVEQLLTGRLAPDDGRRYCIRLSLDEDAYDQFLHARALLRHQIPDGDPTRVFVKALGLLIADVERRKIGLVERPRASRSVAAGSRHIPANIRRDVWERDGGRCAFQGPQGRCPETGFLEFHHVLPFAEGGRATLENIELRCRAHNNYEARVMCPA